MGISTKTEELNDLVAEINSLNEQIVAAGGTTIDPGTTAQTVPTVSTNGPAASTSAGPSGSTWGSPTGSTSGAPTGPTSGAPTGSTSGAPTGSTSGTPAGSTSEATSGTSASTAAPTTQSVEDLSQAASAATATKEAAAAAITAATATKEAAASVSSDLASIDLSSFLGSRRKSKRQSETTTVYPKPGQCDDIKTAMDAIANALDGTNSATYNPRWWQRRRTRLPLQRSLTTKPLPRSTRSTKRWRAKAQQRLKQEQRQHRLQR